MEFNGIVAGIGDVEENVNAIVPEMDAYIYDFIIGRNGIITGLDLSGSTLTSGICVCQGYRGELPSNVTVGSSNAYIYAKFVVNHDINVVDEFSIVTSETALLNTTSDLKEKAGTYYLLLYSNNILKAERLSYPFTAQNAELARNLTSGTIGKDVVATTQPVDDVSDKVATTAFVLNRIDELINSGETKVSLSKQYGSDTTAQKVVLTGDIYLYRKAKYVYAELLNFSIDVHITGTTEWTFSSSAFSQTIPSAFRPTKTISFGLFLSNYGKDNALRITIDTNGTITLQQFTLSSSSGGTITPTSIGYETN